MIASANIAITGAAGLIGSHAAAVLERMDVPIRLLIGPPSEARVSKARSPTFAIQADITDGAALDQVFKGVDVVIHAAGPPSVAESLRDPAECMRVHALGTTAVLQACVRCKVARLVHISSAEVYGKGTVDDVSEDAPLAAASPYGAAKIGAEQMVRAFVVAGSIEALVLRPFSIYGPGMGPAGVVAEFLGQARAGAVIAVRDPKPVRDFCFVGDVARAIVSACTAPLHGFTVVNIGSGIATSIGELAQLAGELGAPGVRDEGRRRPHGTDIVRLVANTARSREMLGWSATTALRDGLSMTLDAMGNE